MTMYLKQMDLFGAEAKFSAFESMSFKSLTGFIFSLLSFIVFIITTLIFGKDFYLKETPRIISESIKTNDISFINLQPNNFTVAFTVFKNTMDPCMSCVADKLFFNI